MARRPRSAPAAKAPPRETHIISNIAYVKHSKEMLGKLKYFTYRNDRDDYISHSGDKKRRRWVDRGLGDHYGAIFHTCQDLQSKDVLAWTYVISPDPALMELVPQRKRRALVERLTEEIVETYYEAREIAQPRYSYVLHDRDASTGKQQLHTHVILPGTVETWDGYQPFYNNRRDGHIDLFNQLAEDAFERELTEMGIDWQRTPPPLEAVVVSEVPEPEPSPTSQLITEILNQWDWSF